MRLDASSLHPAPSGRAADSTLPPEVEKKMVSEEDSPVDSDSTGGEVEFKEGGYGWLDLVPLP